MGIQKGCNRCSWHLRGKDVEARKLRHSEACRKRIYEALRKYGDKRVKSAADVEDRDRVRNPPRRPSDEAPTQELKAPVVEEESRPQPATPRRSPDPPLESADDQWDAAMAEPEESCPPTIDLNMGDGEDDWDETDTEMPPGTTPVRDDVHDHEMTTMMDVLQCLGVSPESACTFSVKVLKSAATTFMEVYGRGAIMEAANGPERNLNVEGLQAFDLRTCKPNGETWDFTKKSDRMEALRIVKERKPMWLIGSPPCTAFSLLNEGLNYKKMDPVRVAAMRKEGRKHLHFMISLYRIQLEEGRHFLHEHPASASSWRDKELLNLLKHGRVNVVTMDQCEYGLLTPGPNGVMTPAKKPTKWASTSVPMLRRLSKRCGKGHDHQHLMGGRAAAASFNSKELVLEILRGMRDTADLEEPWEEPDVEMVIAMAKASITDDGEKDLVAVMKQEDLARQVGSPSIKFKYADGRVTTQKLQFKAEYKDEYTGEILPSAHIHKGIVDELAYFCDKVLLGVPMSEALADGTGKVIPCRWVNCNKNDAADPDVRARLVAQEVAHSHDESFYAATPPLESKRMLFSQWATEGRRGGKLLKISFIDVRKAYFNGIPTRNLYVRLPTELGLPRDTVGKLVRCMYGTRDAGAIWEGCYVDCLKKIGFTQGAASPCCFYHATWDVAVVVHGDDFTALGTDVGLNLYKKGMTDTSESKIKGRLGMEKHDMKEMRVLNRIVRWHPGDGVAIEADPRHVEIAVIGARTLNAKKLSPTGEKSEIQSKYQ